MSFPVLQPSGIPPSRLPVAAAAVREPAVDVDGEGLIEGLRRRGEEFVAELRRPAGRLAWGVIGGLTILLLYSYWPGLLRAQWSWADPQYSHGWLVPVFAVLLLFWWREPVETVALSARLAGLGLLVATFALRLVVARYKIVTIDMYTFVPALAGVFLFAGGWKTFRWSWAPIAFLILMFPLPDEATRYLLSPLQTLATIVSTYALQTMGFDAWRSGNIIDVGGHRLNVVDACAGLRMLTIFVALSVALVLVGGRDWWENAVVIMSAVPIALLVNAIRITTAGVLHVYADPEFANSYHESTLAGVQMMVLAMAMLFGVQQLLARLFVAEEQGVAVLPAARRTGGTGPERVVSPAKSALSPMPMPPGSGVQNGLD
ncbi:MAG: exosortase/archaeosortase family protein [Planctomycetia bacterium]